MNNSEIFEIDTSDQPLEIKTKQKKQMSPEKKQELLDRLKAGRDRAKAKRAAIKAQKTDTDTEPLLESTTDVETTESNVFTTVMDISNEKEKVKKVKAKRGAIIDQQTKSKYKDYIDSKVSELINEKISSVKKNRKPKDEMRAAIIEKPSVQQPPPLKPKVVEPPPRKVISTFSRRLPWMK